MTVYISNGEKTKMPNEYESDRRYMNLSIFDYSTNSRGAKADVAESDIKATGYSDPLDIKVIEQK